MIKKTPQRYKKNLILCNAKYYFFKNILDFLKKINVETSLSTKPNG